MPVETRTGKYMASICSIDRESCPESESRHSLL